MTYKISRLLEILFLPLGYLIAVPLLLIIRAINKWFVIRWACLISPRIGHFAANTELYCCERDEGINTPSTRHIDIFWLYPTVCNHQLLKMWKRHLIILPRILMHPLDKMNENLNRFLPSNGTHDIGCGKYVEGKEVLYPPHSDRDIYSLLDTSPPHLEFTENEKLQGLEGLREMNIPLDAHFICLIVRDSSYLNATAPKNNWDYHNYRNIDVDDFILAAETLAEFGYYVIRMGHHVEKPIGSKHPKVIDYAVNGLRNDFMDIYLGANCNFCISSNTGYDAIPTIFRRPIVYIGNLPLSNIRTSSNRYLVSTRHHYSKSLKRNLTMKEIFDSGLAFKYRSKDFESKNVTLLHNTPEEIEGIVLEMKNRLEGSWRSQNNDHDLQNKFWKIFKKGIESNGNISSQIYHGKFNSIFSSIFLRNNSWWLE